MDLLLLEKPLVLDIEEGEKPLVLLLLLLFLEKKMDLGYKSDIFF